MPLATIGLVEPFSVHDLGMELEPAPKLAAAQGRVPSRPAVLCLLTRACKLTVQMDLDTLHISVAKR